MYYHPTYATRIKELFQHCFSKKNGDQRYCILLLVETNLTLSKPIQNLVININMTRYHSKVVFLIDNIFVLFGGRVFQQMIGIPVDTNCAPLLADLFLRPYGEDFFQELLKNKERKLAQTFNSSFCYILVDDVLSLNNSRVSDYIHRIYPNELEIKDTTDTQKSASYLDFYIEIDNGGRLKTNSSTNAMPSLFQ